MIRMAMTTDSSSNVPQVDTGSTNRTSLYGVRLSWTFVTVSLLLSMVGPYYVAKNVANVLTSTIPSATKDGSTQSFSPSSSSSSRTADPNFPIPILHPGKPAPNARYTGHCFDDPHPSSTNKERKQVSWSQHRIDVHMDLDSFSPSSLNQSDVAAVHVEQQQQQEEEHEYDHRGGPYEPAGQHLLIDIRHVDPSFLLDTKRLVQAMVHIVTLSKLTLLSYHCHDLQVPMGVSCVGVLLESHVSLHTWPSAGVITLGTTVFPKQETYQTFTFLSHPVVCLSFPMFQIFLRVEHRV